MTRLSGWARLRDWRLYMWVTGTLLAGTIFVSSMTANTVIDQRFRRIEQLDRGQRELRKNNSHLIRMSQRLVSDNAKLIEQVRLLRLEVGRLGGDPSVADPPGPTTTLPKPRAGSTTTAPPSQPSSTTTTAKPNSGTTTTQPAPGPTATTQPPQTTTTTTTRPTITLPTLPRPLA